MMRFSLAAIMGHMSDTALGKTVLSPHSVFHSCLLALLKFGFCVLHMAVMAVIYKKNEILTGYLSGYWIHVK